MSIVSSNMISKHYCPKCNSFDLAKLRRGFIHKRILGSENKFQCKSCKTGFKQRVFERNVPKEIPVSIDASNAIASEQLDSQAEAGPLLEDMDISSLLTSEPDPESNNDFMSEDNFKVIETKLPKSDPIEPAPAKKTRAQKAPPATSSEEQLVDELILVKEKKGLWPYVMASLLVLLGSAYAFIWMPLMSNAGMPDLAQMDMTIGAPMQEVAEIRVNTQEKPPKAELAEIDSKPIVVDETEALELVESVSAEPEVVQPLELAKAAINDFEQAPSDSLPAIDIAKDNPEPKIEVAEVAEAIESTLLGENAQKSDDFQVISLSSEGAKLGGDFVTKADKALGGLTSEDQIEEIIVALNPKVAPIKVEESVDLDKLDALVDVPLPDASVRQYVVSDSVAAISVAAPKVVRITAPAPRKVIATKRPKKVVAKKQATNDTIKLMEKVTVRFMEQDLDRLLPQ